MTGSVEKLAVECGRCGWRGKRSAGNVVFCPKCGAPAAFQIDGAPVSADNLGRVASTCLETAYGSTVRLSYQIKVF